MSRFCVFFPGWHCEWIFVVLLGVFEGCFGKRVSLVWCFGGAFVVLCMAGVVVERPYSGGRKMRQVLQLYFWLPAARVLCRLVFDRVRAVCLDLILIPNKNS
jgi:hypothetical protein